MESDLTVNMARHCLTGEIRQVKLPLVIGAHIKIREGLQCIRLSCRIHDLHNKRIECFERVNADR